MIATAIIPGLLDKLRREQSEVLSKHGPALTYEALNQHMPLLDATVRESTRWGQYSADQEPRAAGMAGGMKAIWGALFEGKPNLLNINPPLSHTLHSSRVLPAAHLVFRRAEEDMQVAGYTLKKGQTC